MIKDILQSLSPEDRRRLVHAFDNGFDQFIELKDDTFVGVNIQSSNFNITEQVGVWSYGEIRRRMV